MNVNTLIRRAGLSLSSEPADTNPDVHPEEIPEDCEHYLCALRSWNREISFHMSTVSGEGPPDTQDALRYLGAIVLEFEACEDAVEWADEFGFDPEHVHTLDAFEALCRMSRDLWVLIGDGMYEELRRGIEIEQAVDIAWAGYVRSQGS